jgi:hypothetical protein
LEQFELSDSLELTAMSERLRSLAQKYEGDPMQLLGILRTLEQLHSEICENLFQPALPNTRHGLFDLLQDIEANGGWPYIYRIGLGDLCRNLIIVGDRREATSPESGEESL